MLSALPSSLISSISLPLPLPPSPFSSFPSTPPHLPSHPPLEQGVLGWATAAAAEGAAALRACVCMCVCKHTCHSLSLPTGCLGRVDPSRVPNPANTPLTDQAHVCRSMQTANTRVQRHTNTHTQAPYAQPRIRQFHTCIHIQIHSLSSRELCESLCYEPKSNVLKYTLDLQLIRPRMESAPFRNILYAM